MSRIAIIKDFNKSCADIVSTATQISDKYTEPLDKVIFEVQTLMQDRDQLSVDELTKYISLIPVMIYNLVDNMQILGDRTDAAKMQRKAEYNKAYNKWQYF